VKAPNEDHKRVLEKVGATEVIIPEKEMVADQLHGPRDLSFIAEYEGILVGFILAKLEYSGSTPAAGQLLHAAIRPYNPTRRQSQQPPYADQNYDLSEMRPSRRDSHQKSIPPP
jgi:hypothetical protein